MNNKIFYDTEFLEGKQTCYQWGLKTDTWLRIFGAAIWGIAIFMKLTMDFSNLEFIIFLITGIFIYSLSMPSTPPTIDLISIGIVSGDGQREYYAISKDFNLKEAWNRYDIKTETMSGDSRNQFPEGRKTKVYWIRENVLKKIFDDIYSVKNGFPAGKEFNYRNMKQLLSLFGKSNRIISIEILDFIYKGSDVTGLSEELWGKDIPIKLYAYYGAYDHVCMMWLWGKMINRPKGLPMFSIDIKQMLDERVEKLANSDFFTKFDVSEPMTLAEKLKEIKKHPAFPQETNAHNALADARWNKELYEFIHKI